MHLQPNIYDLVGSHNNMRNVRNKILHCNKEKISTRYFNHIIKQINNRLKETKISRRIKIKLNISNLIVSETKN